MDAVELYIWGGKMGEWGDSVALNFGPLALEAGSCPSAYICIDPRPHVSNSKEALGCSNPRIR